MKARLSRRESAYHILVEITHVMKRVGAGDDTAFAMYLARELGMVTVPGPSFDAHAEGGRTKIRFCVPRTDGVLREAGERLQQLPAP